MYEYAKEYRGEDSQQFDYSLVWDSKKLYGCVCDEGYEGYDCSLSKNWVFVGPCALDDGAEPHSSLPCAESCPRGDDPLTKGQLNEVQLVKCVASGGSFVLYHRGNPSATMSYKASAYDVEKALEVGGREGGIWVVSCPRWQGEVLGQDTTRDQGFGGVPVLCVLSMTGDSGRG